MISLFPQAVSTLGQPPPEASFSPQKPTCQNMNRTKSSENAHTMITQDHNYPAPPSDPQDATPGVAHFQLHSGGGLGSLEAAGRPSTNSKRRFPMLYWISYTSLPPAFPFSWVRIPSTVYCGLTRFSWFSKWTHTKRVLNAPRVRNSLVSDPSLHLPQRLQILLMYCLLSSVTDQ